jgi:hypothetical protein
MPERETLKRAYKDKEEGKSPSTQAGEFVREEMDHIREGKHGARSAKQAIAIGLSKARRAGVDLPPPKAAQDSARGRKSRPSPASPKRSRAVSAALRREGGQAASHGALSRQAHASARGRSASSRSTAARKAAQTRKRNRH